MPVHNITDNGDAAILERVYVHHITQYEHAGIYLAANGIILPSLELVKTYFAQLKDLAVLVQIEVDEHREDLIFNYSDSCENFISGFVTRFATHLGFSKMIFEKVRIWSYLERHIVVTVGKNANNLRFWNIANALGWAMRGQRKVDK
jgi:hypothetical protein